MSRKSENIFKWMLWKDTYIYFHVILSIYLFLYVKSSLNEPPAAAVMGVFSVYMNCFPHLVFYSKKKNQKQNCIFKFVPQTHTHIVIIAQYRKKNPQKI